MGKYIITAFFCMVMAVAAQAQQATGGIAQNKKQNVESLNQIRFQQMQQQIQALSEAMETKIKQAEDDAKAARDAIDLKYSNKIDGAEGLASKVTTVESNLNKVAACKPVVSGNCSVPATQAGSVASNTKCSSGYMGSCSAECTYDGLKITSNSCRVPKACSAVSNKAFSVTSGNFVMSWTYTYTFASLPKVAHGATASSTCTKSAYLATTTTHSGCKARCSDGKWSYVSAGSCTNNCNVQSGGYSYF